MSIQRGWDAFNLLMTDKIPHSEFISNDEFILKKTGFDTRKMATTDYSNLYKNMDELTFDSDRSKVDQALARIFDYDLIHSFYEMPIKGRYTFMGHAAWSEFDKKESAVRSPFKDIDEVLDFDPVKEYCLYDFEEVVNKFKNHQCSSVKAYPDAVIALGRYNTLFSACIRTFGWEMFLSSVPHNEKQFDRVLEGFYELCLIETRAWAQTDLKVFICHDDIAWTTGPVFNPDWYRKYIFPRYKRLWEPLKEKGIKIFFFADGNYTEFIDDIFQAGADGIGFEIFTSLDYAINKYGKDKVILGNADCRILQFGKKKDILREVKRCTEIGKNCPGYFMAITNHIANKIPVDNIEYYFECFEELRDR